MFLIAQWTREWTELKKYPFIYYTSTNSTNDESKTAFDNKKNIVLFIAEFQAQGRGRQKNKWLNSDMMLSWSFPVKQPPQPDISKLMGLVLYSALKKTWPSVNFTFKLPNDIYINTKKLAGLLIEVVTKGDQHQLIIGTGMNVLKHPKNTPFTHLAQHLPKEQVSKTHWFSFMNNWNDEIYKTINNI